MKWCFEDAAFVGNGCLHRGDLRAVVLCPEIDLDEISGGLTSEKLSIIEWLLSKLSLKIMH